MELISAREVQAGDRIQLAGSLRRVDEVLDEPPESDSSCFTRSDNVWLRTGGSVSAIPAGECVRVERKGGE